jgi:hypothetical protein
MNHPRPFFKQEPANGAGNGFFIGQPEDYDIFIRQIKKTHGEVPWIGLFFWSMDQG